MKKSNVHIVHFITSMERAGAQAVLLDKVKYLKQEGIKQSVLFIYDGYMSTEFIKLGVFVYHIKGFMYPYDPLFWYRLYRVLRDLRPTTLHTVLWSAGFSGRMVAGLLGIRQIHGLHNTFEHNGWLRNLLDTFTGAAEITTIAVSHGVADSLKRAKVPYKKVVVIQNSIDIDELERCIKKEQKLRKQLGLLPEHFVIGSVGRLETVKNYDLLLKACAVLCDRYPFVRVIIVGSGSLEKSLRQLVFELKISDRVLFIINQSAYGYYPLFDCFALSSHTEGLSMALLEAMGYGIGCVVSNSEILHDVIKHESTGLLVNRPTVQNFSDTLERFILEKSLKAYIGIQAKKAVREKFDCYFKNRQYRELFICGTVCVRSEQERIFFR